MTTIRLPASLTPDEADQLAASFTPSWHQFFGAPAAGSSADAVVAQKVVSVDTSKPISRRSKMKRRAEPEPRTSTPVSSGPASASDPINLPTEGGGKGLLIGGGLAAAAIIGLIFAFSGGDGASDGNKNTGAPANASAAKSQKQAAPAPKPSARPVAQPAPEPAEADKPEAPEPSTPEPSTPAPTDDEAAPPASPAPQATPKPVTVAQPFPKPKPQKPKPKPKKPKPKPAGNDSIVRDVPF